MAPRFLWQNLSDEAQRSLAEACNAPGDDRTQAEALTAAFGEPPKDHLVTECWHALCNSWLAHDEPSRRFIVESLRQRKLGQWQRRTRSVRGDLEYLATCRPGKQLREVVLERLIEVGSTPRTMSDQQDTARIGEYRRFRPGSVTPPADGVERAPHKHQIEAWKNLDECRPLGGILVLPTGAGKTFTAVHWLLRNILANGKSPVLWLAHRAELLEQAARTFEEHGYRAGRSEPILIRTISGQHGAPVTTLTAPADVTLCTVQSLRRRPELVEKYFAMHPTAVMVIDEAHHAAARSYRDIVTAARKRSKSFELLGLTATPTRTDPREIGLLKAVFPDGVIYEVEQSRLIREGILSRPIVETVDTGEDFEVDLSRVEAAHMTRFGELHPDTLRRIALSNSRNNLIVDRYVQHQHVYGRTLVFAASIAHADGLAHQFKDAGIKANYVASRRDPTDAISEGAILDSYRSGGLDVLVSVAKLTEGFDAPATNTVFLARPTGSLILLKQMIGRGMRGPGVGGEPTVRLVSFNDHWDRFSDWLDPIYLFDQPLVATQPGAEPVRMDTSPIPWPVIRELTRLAQRPIPAELSSPAIGWYDLPINGLSEMGSRAILVWEHQVPGYAQMIRDARNSKLRRRKPQRYFEDIREPLPSEADLRSFVRYLFDVGTPDFIAFEDRDEYSPSAVADRVTRRPAQTVAKEAELIYSSHALVRYEYGTLDNFLAAVHREIDRRSLKAPPFDDSATTPLVARKRLPPGRHDLDRLRDSAVNAYAATLERAAETTDQNLFPLPPIRWSTKRSASTWAFHRSCDSALGCGIVVNQILNTSVVSSATLDFLIYHELLHHVLGNDLAHRDPFRQFERMHPSYIEADADLDSLIDRYVLAEGDRASKSLT